MILVTKENNIKILDAIQKYMLQRYIALGITEYDIAKKLNVATEVIRGTMRTTIRGRIARSSRRLNIYIRIAKQIGVPIYFKYAHSGEVVNLADDSVEESLRSSISNYISKYPGTRIDIAKRSGQHKSTISELGNRTHNNRHGLLTVMATFSAFGAPMYFVTDPKENLNG